MRSIRAIAANSQAFNDYASWQKACTFKGSPDQYLSRLVIIACHHVAGRTDEKAIWLGLPIDDKELVVDRDLIRDAM
jgi:hypothetical protein